MSEPPAKFKGFMATYEDVGAAYEQLSRAAHHAGPLSDRERRLVKLGLAIGNLQEGGVHSQTRKCLDAGIEPEAIRHAAILAVTTMGWPNMMKAMTWVEDVLGEQ